MNHIYKVVFNKATGTFVAVAEYAKGQGKKSNHVVGSSQKTKSSNLATRTFVLSSLTAALIGLSGTAMGAMIDGNRYGGATNIRNITIATNNEANSTPGTQDEWAIAAPKTTVENGEDSVAIGSKASIINDAGQVGSGNIAIGRLTQVVGKEATLKPGLDKNGNPYTNGQKEFEYGATKKVSESIAIGSLTRVAADQSIGIGNNVLVSGDSSIAIGGDDINTAKKKIISGKTVATLLNEYSGIDVNAAGEGYRPTMATGEAAVVLGVQAQVEGDLATAVGTRTTASALASSAFGVGANASKTNSVALGAGSTTTTNATTEGSGTIRLSNNSTIDFTQEFAGGKNLVAGDQVSVGKAGFERQIKNVAPGKVSTDSTDAINGSQLYLVADKLATEVKKGFNVQDNGGAVKGTVTPGDAVRFNNGDATTATVATEVDGVTAVQYDVKYDDKTITNGTNGLQVNTTTLNVPNGAVTVPTGNQAGQLVNAAEIANTINQSGFYAVSNKEQKLNGELVNPGDEVRLVGGDNVTVNRNGSTFTISSTATGGDAFALKINADKNTAGNNTNDTDAKTVASGSTVKFTDDSADQTNPNIITTVRDNEIGFKLNDVVKVGNTTDSTKHPITIDGNEGNITGLVNNLPDAPATGTPGTVPNNVNNSSAATVGDVLNAGFNLQQQVNGTNEQRDFVKAYDNVVFADGNATKANVTSDGTTSTIKYDVQYDNDTIKIDSETGKLYADVKATAPETTDLNANTDGSIIVPASPEGDKFVTANEIATTINESGFKVNSGATGTGSKTGNAGTELVNPGDTITYEAGDNLTVNQSGDTANPVFTFATKDDVTFNRVTSNTIKANNSITIGGDTPETSTTISSTGDSLNVNGDKITNVAPGEKDNDAATVGQLAKVEGGTNIAGVAHNDATNTYTVNAEGTNVVTDADSGLSVTGGDTLDANNDRNFKVDLSQGTKDTLATVGKGFNIAADNGAPDNVQLGDTVTYTSKDKNIVTTVSGDNEIDFSLANVVNVGDANTVTIDGNKGTVNNLTNITYNPDQIVSGQAATEDQLQQAAKASQEEVTSTDGSIKVDNTKKTADGATIFDVAVNTDNKTITKNADGSIKAVTTPLTNNSNGMVNAPTNLDGTPNTTALATADTVATAINKSGFNVTSGEVGTGVTTGTSVDLVNPGSEVKFQAGDNMVLEQDGRTFTYSVSKDPNFNSVTLENSNGDVTNLTTSTDGLSVGGDKITNVADGDISANSTDAVNGSQLFDTNTQIEKGFNITADNSELANGQKVDNVKLGGTVNYTSKDGNIVTTVGDDQIDFGLDKDLTVGDDQNPGTIVVKGENGKDGVSINGADGTIGLNGKDGANGTISV
ncbi:ESPR-type extended signal peptide-containing protein, partial [Psychrobacter lutiphocae]|uniref:ESPR-type extended signal peptide-containing protein n=1 Tax=Psychrobacter lutiphocae TaxID=540500 RepID=UPI0003742715